MVPRDDTRAFKLNRARSLCVIIIILTNITRILYANSMQFLKKSDYIKNKQLSLSLRYMFVKMLLNGQEIELLDIMLVLHCRQFSLSYRLIAVIFSVFLPTGSPTAALCLCSVPAQTEQHVT